MVLHDLRLSDTPVESHQKVLGGACRDTRQRFTDSAPAKYLLG